MKKMIRPPLLIGVVALLVSGAMAGCGDKAGSTSGKDAAKYMGGPPPGMSKSGGNTGTGGTGAPPGPSGAAPAGAPGGSTTR